VSAANRLNAAAIVSLAGSGSTALLLSKWHPQIPVIGLASKPGSLRRLNVLRGVIPCKIDGIWDMEKQVDYTDKLLIENELAKAGDTIIIVAAVPLGDRKETNTIRLHKVRSLSDRPFDEL
jgi:pyruvate kinase